MHIFSRLWRIQLPSFHHSDQRNSFTLYTIVIESIPHLIVVLLKCSVRGQMGSFSDFIMLLRITSAANYVLLGWVLRFPQGLFPLVLVRICFCHLHCWVKDVSVSIRYLESVENKFREANWFSLSETWFAPSCASQSKALIMWKVFPLLLCFLAFCNHGIKA